MPNSAAASVPPLLLLPTQRMSLQSLWSLAAHICFVERFWQPAAW